MSISNDIKAWNERRRKDLIKSYNQKGFKASGNWAKSLTPTQSIKPTSISIKMLGEQYTGAMTDGRKRGKMPPVDTIRKWIDDKGITPDSGTKDNLAWAIAKKIGKDGSLQKRKPDPKKKRLVTDAYTDEDMKELYDIIRKQVLFDIQTTIKKI